MITILAQDGAGPTAQEISDALVQEFSLPVPPEIVGTNAVWSRPVEWDDLLLVVFNSSTLPPSAVQFIAAYRAAHTIGGHVIPVGVDPNLRVPPDPIGGIKAIAFDGTPQVLAQVTITAGVFLGLSLRPGRQKIFVSYRANDGTVLANSIHSRLKEAGFDAWLDEAQDNLPPGTDVQQEIEKKLKEAAMVLLVDTPNAPDSKWVKIEVDLANSQLIPVLPAVAGDRVPRFIQLQGLRRWSLIKQDQPLDDVDWTGVRDEVYQLLLSTFRRRLRILTRTKKAFLDHGYQWIALDDCLRMYRCEKQINPIRKLVALSHCLVQDVTYIPAIQAWWNYLSNYQDLPTVNEKLCIYDRDKLLSETEIAALADKLPQINGILVHWNELDVLVASNFAG
jgi:hypothetical protein